MSYLAQSLPSAPEVEYFELGEHARPAELRRKLQERIDAIAAAPRCVDTVLLAYGLCGRATDGLVARRETLILPRAHDCATMLLGSRAAFAEHFREMPSTPFSSVGCMTEGNYFFQADELMLGDSYAELVRKYGEEDARYIREAMTPRLDGKLQNVLYIENEEVADSALLARCRERAAADGREFRVLSGSLRLLAALLRGGEGEDFLRVSAGNLIRQTGDWDEVITQEKSE